MFINYNLLRYPYINIEKLIRLRQLDPYFEVIIGKCNHSPDKRCIKEGNHSIVFLIRQEVLLKTFQIESGLKIFQLRCPKIILPDTLLTFHRQPSSLHCGVSKLMDKFSECFYSPDLKSYFMQIVESCFTYKSINQ